MDGRKANIFQAGFIEWLLADPCLLCRPGLHSFHHTGRVISVPNPTLRTSQRPKSLLAMYEHNLEAAAWVLLYSVLGRHNNLFGYSGTAYRTLEVGA